MRAQSLRTAVSTLAVVLVAFVARPSSAADAQVTLEKIMADPDWIGNAPEGPFWGDDGRTIYFERKRQGEKIDDLWRVGADGSTPELVPTSELSTFGRPGGDYNSDFTKRVYEHAGDLFVLTVATGEVRQLTRTAEAESSPSFLVGDGRVAFERGDSDLILDLESGLLSSPAELRMKKDPAEEESGFDDLEARQLRLYRKLAEAKAEEELEREHQRELRRDDLSRSPEPWYLGEEIEIVGRALSPSAERLLLVTREKDPERGREGIMPNYVTRSGFVETGDLRTRVGRNSPPGQSLILLDLETHERHDLDLTVLPGIQEDPLADLRAQAIEWHVEKDGADREKVEKELEAPETRTVMVWESIWSDDGRQLAIQLQSIDNKDRWIVTVDFDGAELVTRHRLTDPAWINWRYNGFGWLPDGSLWYLSEETGFSHLYVLDLAEGEARALTSGEHEVSSPEPDRAGESIYFRANVDHPGDYEVYRVDLASGRQERLTDLGGLNDYVLSPDERRLLVTHSEIDQHPELFVQEAAAGASARRLTFTVSEEFEAIDWAIPEIVAVPSSHVAEPIFSKLYRPRDFDPARSYPAVVFVHGAGYLQNSHRGWAGYFREFMFHTLLVEHGYLVLDMDYRASAGYGRDWRTAIYRQMGHPELEDLQDGVAWLVENHAVDPERVGVYGGSYGGFMTFMALFRDPDLFAAGAALRPVTDWTHYNHDYTSNILNTPQIDPEAFQRSSPIEFAEHLSKPLLIASGMQDNNVFFQDTVLLVQRLIELKKEDFETAFYPLDPHGFVHPESWLDEYRRIFKLFERYVRPSG